MKLETADTRSIASHSSLITHHSSFAVCLVLILFAAFQQTALAQHPVRWTRDVAPPSRSALEAKLRAPVKHPRGQKINQHFGRGSEIRTCVDYLRALKAGWGDSTSLYEMTTESFFKDQCDVAWLTLAAKPSRVLLFKANYALEGTMRYYCPMILTRVAPGGPLKAVEVEDETIQKIAAKVMHTGSGKSPSSRGQ